MDWGEVFIWFPIHAQQLTLNWHERSFSKWSAITSAKIIYNPLIPHTKEPNQYILASFLYYLMRYEIIVSVKAFKGEDRYLRWMNH